jgi:hypothetical protein
MHERDVALAVILGDLDRCSHGRHRGDRCAGYDPQRPRSGCPGGVSLGNPFLRPGTPIGYDRTGMVYVVPPHPYTTCDPEAWRTNTDAMPTGFEHPDDNPDLRPRPAGWPLIGDLLGPRTTSIPDHVVELVDCDGTTWRRAEGTDRYPDGLDGQAYDWTTSGGAATSDGLLHYTPLQVTQVTRSGVDDG